MTTLTLELSAESNCPQSLVDALTRLVAFAGSFSSDVPTGNWTVTLLLTDDHRISELHGEFFRDPSPTDVITFPFDDEVDIGTGDDVFGDGGSAVDHLGDIVVSVDTASMNAIDIGHSADREVAFLTLHGLLHLFGFRDDTPEQRAEMLSRQDELLSAFERREATPWS